MIALRLDIDETVGGGHFQRCMALAGSLPCDKVLLLFRADEGFFNQRSTAFSSLRIPRELPLEAEAAYLAKERPDLALEAIFLDISNARSYSQLAVLPTYFSSMTKLCPNIVLIDGMPPDAILSRLPDPEVKFVLTPYVGAKRQSGAFTHLCGPDYFILPKRKVSVNSGKRAIAASARKILVTMGRSDPAEATIQLLGKVLEPLVSRHPDLQISVVVGDLFSEDHKRKLRTLASNFKEYLALLEQQTDLLPLFEQTDFAITSSGLTKYELAFSGTPCAFVAMDPAMKGINEEFSKAGSGMSLGQVDTLDSSQLVATILNILKDQEKRIQMSQAGSLLIDGQGTSRLVNATLGAKV